METDIDQIGANVFKTMVIVFGLILVTSAVGTTISIKVKEQTKQEAIKAGLYQDDNGHWVKGNKSE